MANINNRYGNAIRGANVVNVSPTLLIGLGGSGKEVLMRLRRLFYTNMRKTGLPIMEYLWIDTDPRRQDIRRLNYDAISDMLYMEATDTINAEIAPENLNNYYNNPGLYSYIFEWLHPSLRQLGPNQIQKGAGGNPPCGRLAFFDHYEEIATKINRKLSLILDPNRITAAQGMGFTVNPATTNVFLVASIAGGTGAGMFLDTSFLLKELSSQGGYNIDTTGILFLPSVFEKVLKGGMIDVTRSNGYASLMELDYHMSPKVGVKVDGGNPNKQFEFKWDGNVHRANIAPLDTIYLLGGKNNAGTRLSSNYTDIFQMAADSIFLEYSDSAFGDEKRSIRVNLQSFLLDETKYDELNNNGDIIFSQYSPNRYSSFGLSFIKLDIDRKRNAAAYYLGQELASHWKSGSTNDTKAIASVNLALSLDGLQNRLDRKSLTEFILREPGVESMTDKHVQSISDGFGAISLWFDLLFNRNNLAGYEACYKEIIEFLERYKKDKNVRKWKQNNIKCFDEENEKFVQPVERQIEDIFVTIYRIVHTWNYVDGKVGKELLINGNDYRQIGKNIEKLFEMIIKNFESEYFKLITTPGATPNQNGIAQADLFCKEYIQEIKNIGKSLTTDDDIPEFTFGPKIGQNNNLNKIKKYKIEAQNFSEPGLFGNSARIITERRYYDSLKTYCKMTKDEFDAHITEVKNKLLNRVDILYKNLVFRLTEQKLEEMINHVKTFSKRANTYQERLNLINKTQNDLFIAYNTNPDDIRYHHIQQPPDNTFYESEIKRILLNMYPGGGAMNWIDYLDKETDNFFDGLYKKTINPTPPVNINTRESGFKYLFETLVKYPAEDSRYKDFQNCMDEYCFKRLENFMDNTDADIEFQMSGVNKNKELSNICEKASPWIQPSPIPIGPQEDDKIGVPSLQQTTTSTQARGNIPTFSTANEIPHEKGNLVFYKEITAFPLIHLNEIEICFRAYSKMGKKMDDIYKRHINYKDIVKLRPLLPPATMVDAQDLFDTGMTVINALIYGCLKFQKSDSNGPGFFFIDPPRAQGIKIVPLGHNLFQTIHILNSDSKHAKILQNNMNSALSFIKKNWPDYKLKQLKVIDHYRMEIFPNLLRAGHGQTDNFDSNIGLICGKLRDKFVDECRKDEAYVDDSILFDTIDNKIKIEDISEIIPYKDPDAQNELRALKGI